MKKHDNIWAVQRKKIPEVEEYMKGRKATAQAAKDKANVAKIKMAELLESSKRKERETSQAFDAMEVAKRTKTHTETQLRLDELKLSVSRMNKPENVNAPGKTEFETVEDSVKADVKVMKDVLEATKKKYVTEQQALETAKSDLKGILSSQKVASDAQAERIAAKYAAYKALKDSEAALTAMLVAVEVKKGAMWYQPNQMSDATAWGLSKRAYDEVKGKAKVKALQAVIKKNEKLRTDASNAATRVKEKLSAELLQRRARIKSDVLDVQNAKAKASATASIEDSVRKSVASQIAKLEVTKAQETQNRDDAISAANVNKKRMKKLWEKEMMKTTDDKKKLDRTTRNADRTKRDMIRNMKDAKYEVKDATYSFQDSVKLAFRLKQAARAAKAALKRSDAALTTNVIWEQKRYLHKVQSEKVQDKGDLKLRAAQMAASERDVKITKKDVATAKDTKQEADGSMSDKERKAIVTEEESRQTLAKAVAKAKQLSGGRMASLETVLAQDKIALTAQEKKVENAKKRVTEQGDVVKKTEQEIKDTIAANVKNAASSAARNARLSDAYVKASNTLKKAKANLKSLSKDRWKAGAAAEATAKTAAKQAVETANAAAAMMEAQMNVEKKAETKAEDAVTATSAVLKETIESTKPQVKSATNALRSALKTMNSDERTAKKKEAERSAVAKEAAVDMAAASVKVNSDTVNKKDAATNGAAMLKTASDIKKAAIKKVFTEKKKLAQVKAASQTAAQKAATAEKAKAAAVMNAKLAEEKITKMREDAKNLEGEILSIAAQKEKLWSDAKAKTAQLRKDWTSTTGSDYILQEKIKTAQRETESKATLLAMKLTNLRKKKADLSSFFRDIDAQNMATAAENTKVDAKKQEAAKKAKAEAVKGAAAVKKASAMLQKRKDDASRLKIKLDVSIAAAKKVKETLAASKKAETGKSYAQNERAKEESAMSAMLAKINVSILKTKTDMTQMQRDQTSRILDVKVTPKQKIKAPVATAYGIRRNQQAENLKAQAVVMTSKLSTRTEKGAGLVDAVVKAASAIDKVRQSHGMISQQVQAVTDPGPK